MQSSCVVTPSAFGAQAGSILWVVDADGQNARPLTRAGQPPGGHASPVWSPDGRFIAFTVFESFETSGVWLLDVAAGRTREIKVGARLYELAFAPDGTALYAAGGEALVHKLPFDPGDGTVTGPAEPMTVNVCKKMSPGAEPRLTVPNPPGIAPVNENSASIPPLRVFSPPPPTRRSV